MKTISILIFVNILLSFYNNIFAEGTKQIMPLSTSKGKLEIYPNFSNFAYFGCAAEDRLCVRINSTNETVYFGFGVVRDANDNQINDMHYQVKAPNGTIVMGGPTVLVPSSGAGFISTYAQAVNGPVDIAPGGYTSLSFTPTMTGDYYFEFEYANSIYSERRVFDFFDITVVNASAQPIDGRVWSKAWQFTVGASWNGLHMWEYQFDGTLYAYSDDGVVTSIDFNYMQPYVFTVSCNETGCSATGDFVNDRKSVSGLSLYPQYKVFLNDPDSLCFPSGNIGLFSAPSTFTGCTPEDYCINVSVDNDGIVEVMLNLNGIAEYQANSADVLLIDTIPAGTTCIPWNGINGLGALVPPGTTVDIYISFITGLTNLPMYDVEFNPNGFKINIVRPYTPNPVPKVYWDDTNVGGATNFIGCNNPSGCHDWNGTATGSTVTSSIGESNTINSWWYASENIKDTLVTTLSNLSINFTVNNITCYGLSNGSLTAIAGNGLPPYTYQWSNLASTPTITGLSPQTYYVTITDDNGCTGTSSASITQPPVVSAIINDYTTSLCENDCNGHATVTALGGTGTFSYIWNDLQGQTWPNAQNLCSGSYSVTISDGNNCSATSSVTILTNEPPSVDNLFVDCIPSTMDYSVDFDVSGGSGPFTVTDAITGATVCCVDGDGHFTGVFPSDTLYDLIIGNEFDCGTYHITGLMNCGCGTYAGTMNLAPFTVCEGATVTAVYNMDSALNSDDLFEFIIHDGSGTYPYTAIATNTEPVFSDSDIPNIIYGQTYYIAAVAGYENTGNPGHVDPLDTCYSQSMGVPVVWLKNPIANIPLDNDEVCGKTIELIADSLIVGTGGWYCYDCQSYITVNNTDYTDYDVWISVADFGAYTFTWAVYNGICFDSDTITIVFKEIPTAYAGADKNVCGNSTELEAVFSIGDNGRWVCSDATFSDEYFNTSGATISNYGYYTFTWTEYNGTGQNACADDDQVVIGFIQQPEPDAGINDTVCGTEYTLNANNTLPDSILFGQWYYNTNMPVYIEDIYSPSTNVIMTGGFHDFSTTINFIWYERNTGSIDPVCETRDTIKVTFFSMPSSNAGVDDEICNNSIQLHADILGGGLYSSAAWSVELVNAVFDTAGTAPENIGTGSQQGTHDVDAWVTITSIGAFGDSALVNVPILWIVSNGNCKAIDTVEVLFYQRPEANAGLDDSICGLTYQFQADPSLDFSSASLWSCLTSSNVTYIPAQPIDANSTVNVPQIGIYEFLWTERNPNMPGLCFDKDTVKITFLDIPNADAGDDFNVCGKETQMAAIPSCCPGAWQFLQGVQFIQPDSPTSDVIVNNFGLQNMRWCESNSFCYGCDTVLVTFYQYLEAEQQVDSLFPDIILPWCENLFPYLDANNYTGYPDADGYWTDVIGGMQVYSPNDSTPNCSVTVSSYGLHIFYWVLTNGTDYDGTPICIDSSEAVKIHFYQRPVTFAGLDDTVCELSALLNADSTIGAQGVWSSTEPSAYFHYNNVRDSTFALDTVTVDIPSYDQDPDYYEFYWQEDSGWEIPGFECSDIDTVRIVFAERPSGEFFFKIPVCYGDTAIIWADSTDPALADIDSARFEWTFGNDTDMVIYGDSIMYGPGPHLVSWTPADTIHPVTLRATSQFGCMSFEYKDTIEEPAPLEPDIIIDPATCGDANGAVTLSTDSNFYSFIWLDGRIADPDDTTVTSVMGGDIGYYLLQISAKAEDQESYPGRYCIDTMVIYIPDTGEVTAMFDTSIFVFTDGLASYDSIVPAEITFTDKSTDAAKNWRWRFYDTEGNLAAFLNENGEEVTESADSCPKVTFVTPGIYYAQLLVSSREGCKDIYEYHTFYIIAQSSLEIPNVFTPNGDGINDVFRPNIKCKPSVKGIKAVCMQTVHGVIFNQWGKKVYEWTYNHGDDESKNGWDGKINNRDASPGVYFYIIEGVGLDGVIYKPEDNKGAVTLIRDRK
ncbi:MAG: gliding motility-associated C-terminal domain-containing protein [Bacteroidia bacterium]|nr:gliding motility-associated C-terminal domain-containing protein [Bacteroidia bacterium]